MMVMRMVMWMVMRMVVWMVDGDGDDEDGMMMMYSVL